MDRAKRIMKYFCTKLEVEKHNCLELIRVLGVLVELFDKDIGNLMTVSAVNLGLHLHLVDILNKPCQYWQESRDDKFSEITGDIIFAVGMNKVVGDVDKLSGFSQFGCYDRTQENNIVDHCNLMHPLMYTLAMKCLHSLSILHKACHLKFVDKHLIQTVLKYLRPSQFPEKCNNFYQFGPRFTASLRGLVDTSERKVKIMVYLKSNHSSELKNLLNFYEPAYFCDGYASNELKDIHFCSMTVRLNGNEVNIVDVLVKKKCAWKDCSQSTKDQNNKEDGRGKGDGKKQQIDKAKDVDMWREAHVTHILRGNFLWVQLGQQCIQAVDELARILQSRRGQLVKTDAVKNDLVAAHLITNNNGCEIIRARVIAVIGPAVTVFDIDTGRINRVPVHSLFCLPSDLHPRHLPSLATLVCLAGVLPVPLDVRAVEIATATLSQICRFSVTASNIIMEDNSACGLPSLIVCPDVDVACQCLHLATNLLLRKNVPWCMWWQHVMLSTVETLINCLQRAWQEKFAGTGTDMPVRQATQGQDKAQVVQTQIQRSFDKKCGWSEGDQKIPRTSSTVGGSISRMQNKNLISRCLMLLVNRLYLSREAKCFFYQIHGERAVIRAYLQHMEDTQIRTRAIQVLCNFIYWPWSTPGTSLRRNPSMLSGLFKLNLIPTLHKGVEHLTTHGTNKLMEPVSVQQNKQPSNLDRPMKIVSVQEGNDGREELSEARAECQHTGDLLTRKLRGLNQMSELTLKRDEWFTKSDIQRRYIKDSRVLFQADSLHEMYLTSQLTADHLASVVCGMLNQGYGGTIYVGIDGNGVAKGEQMSCSIRDEIRLGVDKVMSCKLLPSVLYSQYQVTFVPVAVTTIRDGQEHVVPSRDLYVVELSCQPIPGIVYCCNGGQSYYRVGLRTEVLKAENIRYMVVLEEEGLHEDQIKELLIQLRKLKAEGQQLLRDA